MQYASQNSMFALDEFALQYVRDKEAFTDIKTEDLAERFRAHAELPNFPSIRELIDLFWGLVLQLEEEGRVESRTMGKQKRLFAGTPTASVQSSATVH